MYDLIIRRGLNKKKVTVCIILLILLVTLATISGIRFAEHHEVKKQAKLYEEQQAQIRKEEEEKQRQEELAKKVGKSRSHVTNIIGLLRLPQEVQQLVADSKITMGHARALSKLESEEEMKALANKIIDEHLPVRQTEEDLSSDKIEKKVKISRVNNNSNTREFKYVEDLLRDKLDTKVRIKEKKIEISFTNVADLNRILEVLNVKE